METYIEMKNRQQKEVNTLPLKFAFGKQQFDEMMKSWGFDPEKDTDKIYSLGGSGGFYKRTDAQLVRDTFKRHWEEQTDAVAADKTGDGFIYQMFYYELENHEYSYTRDSTDAINALGYDEEDIKANERLHHGLRKAAADIVKQSERSLCWPDNSADDTTADATEVTA